MSDAGPAGTRVPTDPKGPTGRLATWLAALTLDDIPAEIRERGKYLTLDGIACALVGAQLPWSRTAVDIVTRFEGGDQGSVIGWGRKTTAPAAALLNGTFIQGFELDDYHPLGPLHSAAVVLPALLAAAEHRGIVDGRQILLAAIAGYEVGPRVGMALHGVEMLSRGWHSGSVFGTHAAAAATGKLLGLDAAAFEDALGLAGTQSAGLMAAQFEAMSKRMHHGFSARNGLYAAILAEGGYTGIKRVFERDYGGFLSTFGEGHAPDAGQIADTLGQVWETGRIVIKPYAAMGGLHAAIDAILAMSAERKLVADEIERVEIDLTHAVYHHGGWKAERPLTAIGAQMNIAYAVAVAILDGAAMVAQFAPDRIDRDDVWRLIPRIEARHDPALDANSRERRLTTRLRIRFRDGTSREMVPPAGAAKPPMTNEAIAAKYRALTAGIMPEARQQAIERLVLSLDTLADIGELTRHLAEAVGSPFET